MMSSLWDGFNTRPGQNGLAKTATSVEPYTRVETFGGAVRRLPTVAAGQSGVPVGA